MTSHKPWGNISTYYTLSILDDRLLTTKTYKSINIHTASREKSSVATLWREKQQVSAYCGLIGGKESLEAKVLGGLIE